MPPAAQIPQGQTVEVRKRAAWLRPRQPKSYVNVSGFRLMAASVNVAGNHNLIDNCQILYPRSFVDPTG